MENNTLYYTFSAIPQVIGAIAAIIAAFSFFRIANLREYLIGDGKSVLNRWGEKGYCLQDPKENKKQQKRLLDAIDRRNILEIKNVILQLRNNEIRAGYSKNDRPHGLQYIYDRFCGNEGHIAKLKRWTLYVIALSFSTIIVSIISLGMTDAIISATCPSLKYWILWLTVALFIVSLILTFRLMHLGLSERTVHEADKQSL